MRTRNAMLTIIVSTFMILLLSSFLSAAVANAHTPDEQNEFWQQWEAEVFENGITPDLLERATTFLSKHKPRQVVVPSTQNAPSGHSVDVGRGMGTNVEQWRPLVAAHFPAEAVNTMMCLMGYESGGNPDAANPRSSARGLFQILYSLWGPHFGVTEAQLYDPETNVALARQIWNQQGYGAWSPYNRGLCR